MTKEVRVPLRAGARTWALTTLRQVALLLANYDALVRFYDESRDNDYRVRVRRCLWC